MSIVSIAGGNQDRMVSSDLSRLDAIVPPTHGITAFSTSIPHVWQSADHQCTFIKYYMIP
jgi:glycosylphosphatidylinositol deacylase